MSQNVIIKGKDNPVIINFSFTGDFEADGLNNFDEITLELGGELYSTIDDPLQLFTDDSTTLRLKIGDSTSLDVGSYLPEIIGYNSVYDDGYLMTGQTITKLCSIVVKI